MLFHYLLFCKTHARTSIKAPASVNCIGYDFRLCTRMLKLWAQRTEDTVLLKERIQEEEEILREDNNFYSGHILFKMHLE